MNEAMDESADLSAMARGDSAAAARLFDRHSKRVHAMAYTIVRDRDAAEDLTHDVFLKLWRRPPIWRSGKSLLPWLLRVTNNLSIDYLRKHKRMIVGDVPESSISQSGPSNLHDADIVRHVHAAIGRLPERQRLAILLTWQNDLSNADAGKALGVSEKALESLLARARARLRKELSEEIQDLI